ncbi:unnamed protein product [Hymenolepis diminuta]|uniref:Protein CASP n=1 Tax=Hymenolepis diminuta TaxID=6216 RepID=A0A564YKA7_HYMDI|nr:unnamed protein product [Hymenolepis diminuta]
MQSVVISTRVAWNEFGFPKLQNELSDTASAIAAAQETGRISRKKLVEVFLHFRNNASEDAKKAAASVLKSFQTEVDNLTSRSQKAEDAFIQVYQRLAEMPDPSLALAEVETVTKQAQRASDLKTENSRLREIIEDLKAEVFVAKSNQTQLRKAAARIEELEEERAQSQRRLEEATEEQERQAAILVAEANARTQDIDLKASSLAEALKAAQSQIFDLQSHLEEVRSAKTRELEILVSDLEKAQERIKTLQQEAQLSKRQAGNDRSATLTSNPIETVQLLTQIEELESQLESKKEEITDLMAHLHTVETERKQESENLHFRLESTEAALRSAQQSLSALQSELQSKSDYDTIKRELKVLRSIEFDQQSDENASTDEALEIRLRRKNEQLQNRIASVNAEKDRVEAELNNLRSANADLAEREAQQKVLISHLEEDLNRVSAWHHQKLHESSDVVGGGQDMEPVSPLREILLDQKEEKAAAGESSILSIVQSQRDRLRQQNRELEENLLSMRQQVVTVQTQLEALRQDNVKLYEKIRFVQSYNSSTNAGSNHAQEDEVLARYSNAYEDRLNPFKQFGQRERQQRYQALQPYEKVMHSLGRMIVHNRGARLATFAYVLVMHLLVFLILYKMVTSTGPISSSFDDNPPKL